MGTSNEDRVYSIGKWLYQIILTIMWKRVVSFTLILIATSACLYANNLAKAKSLYQKGEYLQALPIFKKQYAKNKKNASINHWLGVCLYETGNPTESIKYLEFADSKDIMSSSYYLAKIYMAGYNFEKAVEMYARYKYLLTDKNNNVPDNINEEEHIAKLAKPMLDHVEKIVVIDSILVDKKNFFKHYILSPETGRLLTNEELPFESDQFTVGFCEQNNTKLIWAKPDELGTMRLCESSRLIDGNWDTPQYIDDNLTDGGNLNYPFLLQDGMTLYYASNGNGSIGGYDIFYTRKDAESGEFLQPQNLGMPYNSFADDYMLVLDDKTGYGWWATDRNNIKDKITIYVFKRNEFRTNYNLNEANLVSFAKLSDYKKTWQGNDYTSEANSLEELLEPITEVSNNKEFVFYVSKNLVYTSTDDFNSEEAKNAFKEVVILKNELQKTKSQLNAKRKEFFLNGSNDEISAEIIALEADVEGLRNVIMKNENIVRETELNVLEK